MTGGGWLRLHPAPPEEAAQGAPGAPTAAAVTPGGAGNYGRPGDAIGPPLRTFRSATWDGPGPQVGALIVEVWRIVSVAAGAGAGHWTMHAERVDGPLPITVDEPGTQVWRWRGDR